MVSETDIRRAAYLLIQRHGEGAEARAMLWAHHFQNVGDLDASKTWPEIGRTITELQQLIALQKSK